MLLHNEVAQIVVTATICPPPQKGSTAMNTTPKIEMRHVDLTTFCDDGDSTITGTPMSTWAQPDWDYDPDSSTRELYVGDPEVDPDRVFTMSEALRLNEIPLPRLEVFGRVDLGRGDDFVLGRDYADDTLAVAQYSTGYRKGDDWLVALKVDVTPDLYEGLALEVNDAVAMANAYHDMYLLAKNSPLISLPEKSRSRWAAPDA